MKTRTAIRRQIDFTALRLLFSLVSICCASSLVGANGIVEDGPTAVAPIAVKAKDDLKACPAPYSPLYCRTDEKSNAENKCNAQTYDLLKVLDQYPYVTANFDLTCHSDASVGRS
jgi:hypothetical protein